jgi:hypothetical protein
MEVGICRWRRAEGWAAILGDGGSGLLLVRYDSFCALGPTPETMHHRCKPRDLRPSGGEGVGSFSALTRASELLSLRAESRREGLTEAARQCRHTPPSAWSSGRMAVGGSTAERGEGWISSSFPSSLALISRAELIQGEYRLTFTLRALHEVQLVGRLPHFFVLLEPPLPSLAFPPQDPTLPEVEERY